MRYRVIYCDCPWDYNRKTKKQDVTSKYNVMTPQQLFDMKGFIDTLTEKDCTLFFWATSPKLDTAIDVIRAWNFDYKTSIVWNKVRPYLGYYVNPIHELLLIAGRGKATPLISSKERNQFLSVYEEKKTTNSKKPDYFYSLIDQLYPDVEKIELFARNIEPRLNWTHWGDEA